MSPGTVLAEVISKMPFVHVHTTATADVVVWQLRMPRLVLGGLVGSMLAVAGASYQGVFSNPLADPYLLGVASGAGLGATIAVVAGAAASNLACRSPAAGRFRWCSPGRGGDVRPRAFQRRRRAPASLVLSGVAVAAFFTAVQTFLQQQNTQDLAVVYTWILGSLATPGWGSVEMVWPYIVAAIIVLLACRRLLDVLSVGDEEATSLGVRAGRVRFIVVVAATLGTAAAVSVTGLIGFVGIIVPHTIRLLAGPSYRRILPLAVLFGAGFLIFADLLARTVLSPQESPWES